MEILPTTLGTRPGLACELRAEGVVAARRGDGSAMAALARAVLPEGAFRPGLRAGTMVDRAAVVAALRQAFEKVVDRSRVVTLVVPDASVRVLLLDFDALPGKAVEALPVVRFRLKKLLPFEADDAAISYQVMSTSRSIVRVVAIAMPREVLAEYESVVREAGFEPGAVLPSTLAVLAGLEESEIPSLVINAGPEGVTAAIVRGGILLLHRSVDMRAEAHVDARVEALPPAIPSELLANPLVDYGPLPLVDRESSAAEWSAQEAVDEFTVPGGSAVAVMERPLRESVAELPASEVVQAVSVAAAYFEDTLGEAPTALMAAGPTGAAHLAAMLRGTSLEDVAVEETIGGTAPAGGARARRGCRVRFRAVGWLAFGGRCEDR